ncbi:MAG: quinoprotein dehydrogenase-associated SoxYZ-like carrier [Betaproteobacteria bacterium TMED82]|nr:MAG: quinoprotein dehydrogenase-associated SoxYZ-like carrier [Betaproteobacteria bacterium TMED82]
MFTFLIFSNGVVAKEVGVSTVEVFHDGKNIVNPAPETEQWRALKESLFPGKDVRTNAIDLIEISAPFRAADAAVVPITISSKIDQSRESYIRKLYLLIDRNPTPVAAIFTLSSEAGRADISTRVRLEEYTYVRAVAELNDGSLHMSYKYVRASGGCSAPAGKDQELALARLGRMKLRTEATPMLGKPSKAQVMISHPNFSGMQKDQLTQLYVPARFVRQIDVMQGDNLLLSAKLDFAVSENPNIRFFFVPKGENDNLKATAIDSTDKKFEKSLAVIASQPTAKNNF